jgi:hypothetical protein
MQLITTIARLFSEIFCGPKNRDMQRFLVVAMHGNATALPGEKSSRHVQRRAQTPASLRRSPRESGKSAQRSVISGQRRVGGRAIAFPFPAKARNSVTGGLPSDRS